MWNWKAANPPVTAFILSLQDTDSRLSCVLIEGLEAEWFNLQKI